MFYPLGAHLVASRLGYTHHGIYIGNGEVVHYLLKEGITRTDLEGFSCGHDVRVRQHPNAPYSGRECAMRARKRMGETKYNLAFNNCEHFATWCATGESRSEQVENMAAALAKAGLCALRMLAEGAGARRIAAGAVGTAVVALIDAEDVAMERQENAPVAVAVALVDRLADAWQR